MFKDFFFAGKYSFRGSVKSLKFFLFSVGMTCV